MAAEQVTFGAFDKRLGPGCNCCGDRTTGVNSYCTACIHQGCRLSPEERRVEPRCTAWQARNGDTDG